MDSEGKDIVGELQLGLLLYRGAVFCGGKYTFNYKMADTICREMNFTRAETWTRKSSSDIQGIKDKILAKIQSCDGVDRESCYYNEDHDCGDNKYVFLSCTGNVHVVVNATPGY